MTEKNELSKIDEFKVRAAKVPDRAKALVMKYPLVAVATLLVGIVIGFVLRGVVS